jgi:hypothetical protein
MTTTKIILILISFIVCAITWYIRDIRSKNKIIAFHKKYINKLEEDKQELVGEIAIILQEEWTVKKAETVNRWKWKFETDKRLFDGSRNVFEKIGGGIISQIQNKQNGN